MPKAKLELLIHVMQSCACSKEQKMEVYVGFRQKNINVIFFASPKHNKHHKLSDLWHLVPRHQQGLGYVRRWSLRESDSFF